MTAPARNTAETATTALPRWDLSALYQRMDDPAIAADQAMLKNDVAAFAHDYQGKIAEDPGSVLAEAVQRYETLEDRIGRLYCYAQLLFSTRNDDSKAAQFYQNMREFVTNLSSQLLFFTLEINKLDDALMEAKLGESPTLAHYRPWLRDVRSYRPYQLDDALEKLLHEKRVAGASAWSRLFDETISRMRFEIDGKSLTSAEALHRLSDKDAETRKTAALAISKSFSAQLPIFALITNTLAKDKAIEDQWRGFKRPISARNVANYVEDEVVDALLEAVKRSYPSLSHRYYALKATWFGKEALDFWDRNAPLPGDDGGNYDWDTAVTLVRDAYAAFSPEMARLGARFFDEQWIDAGVYPGKDPGAFSHPTVPSAHPFILMNFQGKARDVMTLAHELGHGVHQLLSAAQGALMADTPLTLAETASVFGEQLTFRHMLATEQDEKRRKFLLAGKVEDMLNTVVRQIAFCEFERQVHAARKEGELTAEQICDLWMGVQSASLGPAIRLEESYRPYWSYIPHFIHTPFYVYAYAFGDCLVNALYAVYQEQPDGFVEKYMAMLKAGGTLRHKELLAPFGLDASNPDFWQKGLDIISRMIDELE